MSDLLNSFSAGLLKYDKSAELLLHVPESIDFNFQTSSEKTITLDTDKLYRVKINTKRANLVSITEVASLPKSNHLSRELLLFLFSSHLSSLICAYEEINGIDPDPDQKTWACLLSSDNSTVAAAIRSTRKVLKTALRGTDLDNWLMTKEESVSNKIGQGNDVDIWLDLLNCCSSAFNQFANLQEERIERTMFLMQMQDAVGWETELEDLFNAMAKTLKRFIAYDYIELAIANPDNGSWKVENVLKRNETDHGGDLLTLILKQQMFNEILVNKQAILLNKQEKSEKYLANPRLLSFMSMRSGVLIPLCHAGKANGILKIFSCQGNTFRKDDLPNLEAIGSILARTINNINAYSGLKRMATVDGLTNVFSRRFFNEHLNREYKRARRYRSALSLIMIDIDYFKHYNDTNGHLAGDKVLAEVAQILKENVRGADLVARYGGEEFVVILPETGLTNGKVVAEKMRDAVESNQFKNQSAQPNGNITISLGIATLTPTVNSANSLINLADIALYEAKNNGRNRCEVANELRNQQ